MREELGLYARLVYLCAQICPEMSHSLSKDLTVGSVNSDMFFFIAAATETQQC